MRGRREIGGWGVEGGAREMTERKEREKGVTDRQKYG